MILITGAGRGLGLELVKKHLEAGDEVFAITHSITPELQNLKDNDAKCRLTVKTCELTDESELAAVIGQVNGRIDILYNVAAIYCEEERVDLCDTSMEKARRMYEVNAIAALNVLKYCEKLIMEGGTVIVVSSEAGSIGECGRTQEYGYCMSKAALNMAAKLFSNANKERNIRVICYHPGWMRTQMGGARAAASEFSISAEESAAALVKISGSPVEPSDDVLFVDYTGKIWKW